MSQTQWLFIAKNLLCKAVWLPRKVRQQAHKVNLQVDLEDVFLPGGDGGRSSLDSGPRPGPSPTHPAMKTRDVAGGGGDNYLMNGYIPILSAQNNFRFLATCPAQPGGRPAVPDRLRRTEQTQSRPNPAICVGGWRRAKEMGGWMVVLRRRRKDAVSRPTGGSVP